MVSRVGQIEVNSMGDGFRIVFILENVYASEERVTHLPAAEISQSSSGRAVLRTLTPGEKRARI